MKKNFLFVIILFLFASSFAQEPKESKTRYYRHEVNVSIGAISVRSGWSNDYENEVMNRFGLVVGSQGGGHGPGTGIVTNGKTNQSLVLTIR